MNIAMVSKKYFPATFLQFAGAVLMIFVLAACAAQPTVGDEARAVVAEFLAASRAGNLDQAYHLLINLKAPSGKLRNGTQFLAEILGPAESVAANKELMTTKMKENYQLVERKILSVSPVEGIQTAQFWVLVEEARGAETKQVGEIRYLVVGTAAGWRIDLARSDLSKALVVRRT